MPDIKCPMVSSNVKFATRHKPQAYIKGVARYFFKASPAEGPVDSLDSHLNCPSCSTKVPRWFVRRLST